jgi:hypothetical protein
MVARSFLIVLRGRHNIAHTIREMPLASLCWFAIGDMSSSSPILQVGKLLLMYGSKTRKGKSMKSSTQPQEDVLHQIIQACEALSEEYLAVLDASCASDSPLSFPEQRAHAVADAAVSWRTWHLGQRLKDFQREGWTAETLLEEITRQVSELVSFYSWHVSQSIRGERSEELRSHMRQVYLQLQDAQQRLAEMVLAPALAHLVLSDAYINIGWQITLDTVPDELIITHKPKSPRRGS